MENKRTRGGEQRRIGEGGNNGEQEKGGEQRRIGEGGRTKENWRRGENKGEQEKAGTTENKRTIGEEQRRIGELNASFNPQGENLEENRRKDNKE